MRSGLTLERELLDLLGSGRNALIAARYYGFDGRGGRSLQIVGNEIGVTRERVRQIVTAASESARSGLPVSPTLNRTITFVVDHMPAAAEKIEAELRSQRLTSGMFRLEGVIRACALLGRLPPFSITEISGERLVHAQDIPSVDLIIRIARRIIARWGMATTSKIVAELRKDSDVYNSELVVNALACSEGFHWLDHSAEWFWLSDNHHNPVLNRIRKILSVANPISISELRAGIGRDCRMKGLLPPEGVLLEFCRQAPGLRVEAGMIQAAPLINSDEVLTPPERDIVHILSEHGGAMATSEFTSVCLGMGMNRQTFYRNVESSPIVSRDGAVYGLIGSRSGKNRDPHRLIV